MWRAWLIVIISFFVLAVQLFVTLIEFKLTTLAGFVLVPFALWNKTAFLAEKVLGNVVSSGIKVLVLAVIVGIDTGLFAEFQVTPNEPSIEHALVVMLASLSMLALGIFGPGIATGVGSAVVAGARMAPAAAKMAGNGARAAASTAGSARSAYQAGSAAASGGLKGAAAGVGNVAKTGAQAVGQKAAAGMRSLKERAASAFRSDEAGPVGISRNTVWRYLRSETTEPAYAERQSASAIDPYAFQLSGWLKTEAAKSRKQRRSLKQLHEDLSELGFKGSYDRVAAFARQWREGQTEWVNSARKRTA